MHRYSEVIVVVVREDVIRSTHTGVCVCVTSFPLAEMTSLLGLTDVYKISSRITHLQSIVVILYYCIILVGPVPLHNNIPHYIYNTLLLYLLNAYRAQLCSDTNNIGILSSVMLHCEI